MKIEKCPFCDKDVAEIFNCQELEGCRHFEKCPATKPYVCVVCNMHEGGCGASSGYYDSEAKAIAVWNRRAQSENESKECRAIERVEGGIPYCSDKQTACDGCKPTNADRIRSMSDEELARFLGDEPPYFSTYEKHLDWLKQPVKEE